MLAIEGIPIFYLELAIGQRLRKGAIGVWNQVNILQVPAKIYRKKQTDRCTNHVFYFYQRFLRTWVVSE